MKNRVAIGFLVLALNVAVVCMISKLFDITDAGDLPLDIKAACSGIAAFMSVLMIIFDAMFMYLIVRCEK